MCFSLNCSVFEDEAERAGLKPLWSAPSTGDVVVTRGGLDALHYYVVRSGHPIGCPPYYLYAYSLSDGKLAWKRPTGPCWTILTGNGKAFCPHDRLEAFNAATGTTTWSYTPEAPNQNGSFQLTRGAIDDHRVYAGTLKTGMVYAFDAATGAIAWKQTFKEADWIGAFIRSVTISADTLFVTMARHYNQNGYLAASIIVALEAATGRELWRFQDGDGSDSRQIGNLTVHGRMLLYADGHRGEFVAVDRDTRAVLWRVAQTPGYLGTLLAPEVKDGIAYGSQGDEHVYAIDVATGRILWKRKPDMGSSFDHAVCGKLLLVDNRALMVLDLATGRKRGILHDPRDETGKWVYTLDVQDNRAYVSTAHGVFAYECPR